MGNMQAQAMTPLSACVYADLRRKWFVEASHCTVEESNADGNGRLALSQAWSVFMVLVVGAGVALIVAVLEILYYRTFFHGEPCGCTMPLYKLLRCGFQILQCFASLMRG